jgi:hypothetical protein
MGTWNAFYVKGDVDQASIDVIHASFGNVQIDNSESCMGVRFPDDVFHPPTDALRDLSAKLSRDVYWLGFQSTVDAFRFHHWAEGTEVRSLVYGIDEERIWERATGTPELWEQGTFFDPEELKEELEFMESDDEREELKRIWREHDISQGAMVPSLRSGSVAHAVAGHYGFPHF